MALDFQLVPINFTGMDTKQDDKLLVPGKLALLQNMWMNKTGTIKKRYGFDQATVAANTFSMYAIAESRSYPVNFGSQYMSDSKLFLAQNEVLSITASKQLLIVPPNSANTVGFSKGTNYSAVFNGVSGNSLYVYAVENESLSAVSPRKLFGTINDVLAWHCFNWTGPNVAYTSSAGVYVTRESGSGSILPPSAASAVRLDVNGTGAICAAFQYNNIVYVVYSKAATNNIYVAGYNLVGLNVLGPKTLTTNGYQTADVYANASGVFCCFWEKIGAADPIITTIRYDLSLSAVTSTTNSSAFTGIGVTYLGKLGIVSVAAGWRVYFSYTESGAQTAFGQFNASETVITSYNCSAITKPFLLDASTPAVFVTADNAEGDAILVTTYTTVDTLPVMLSRGGFFFGRLRTATTVDSSQVLLNSAKTQISDLSGEMVLPEIAFTNIEGSSVSTGKRESMLAARYIKLQTLTAPPPSHDNAANEIVNNSFGDVRFFDGFFQQKSGFYARSRAPLLTQAANATGLTAGTYLYVIMYEYVDAVGNLNRSAPSDPTTLVVAGGATVQATVRIWNQSFNAFAKTNVIASSDAGISAVIYRTLANGTVFYRLGSSARFGIQNQTLFQDTTNDTALAGSTPLYTTGGILENVPAPAARSLGVGKSRVFVCSAEQDELWFSKKFVTGELPSFNEALSLRLDSQGGNAVVPIEMDDKILILKENIIQAIYGDGPDETGANPFQGPQIVSTEIGAVNCASAVLTDDGVMFKSKRGIYLCDRGLQVSYIGKEIADYNANVVIATHNLRDRDQAWFWTTDGNTLIYDSFHRIWSVYTGQICQDATMIGNVPHYINMANPLSPVVLKENHAVFSENGTAIPLVVRTGWMSLAGIQGFQRIRKLIFIGKSYAAHTVTVKLYYDFNATEFETISVSSATIMPPGDSVYQYSIRPKQQKCESFKFELSVTDTTQAFELSNFALEVGVKGKSNRMPKYKRAKST